MPICHKPLIMKKSIFNPIQTLQRLRRASATLTALGLTAVLAFGGTVSPQLASMPPNQTVQVIVQYPPSLVGGLVSTVCTATGTLLPGVLNLVGTLLPGVVELLELLPGGELCSMTVANA